MTSARILIVDDHPLFRDAIRLALSNAQPPPDFSEAGSLDEASAILSSSDEIDLVLLDLRMPGVQGLSGLLYLRSSFPAVPVVIVSGLEEQSTIRRALSLGASGYISKSTPASGMRDAVKAILEGQLWVPANINLAGPEDEALDALSQRLATLTPQQVRVLMMLKEGKLNKQIAFELAVTEATVKAHVSAILQKLDVDSRTQAVIAANRLDGEPTSPS